MHWSAASGFKVLVVCCHHALHPDCSRVETVSDPTDLQFSGFGVANYRSFDEVGFVVDHIGQINVFIGKNNSGKSNIIGPGMTT